MTGQNREDVEIGKTVDIVLKEDQRQTNSRSGGRAFNQLQLSSSRHKGAFGEWGSRQSTKYY